MKIKALNARLIVLKEAELLTGKDSWNNLAQLVEKHFYNRLAGTIITMHHGICLGSYKDESFNMPPDLELAPNYLLSLRVFTQDKEFYMWQSDREEPGLFRYRLREDKEADREECNVQEAIETCQMLWGSSLKFYQARPDWALLQEKRGTSLRITSDLINLGKIGKDNRLWLITRNYINYTPVGQAGYIDSRWVKLVEEGELYNGRWID